MSDDPTLRAFVAKLPQFDMVWPEQVQTQWLNVATNILRLDRDLRKEHAERYCTPLGITEYYRG